MCVCPEYKQDNDDDDDDDANSLQLAEKTAVTAPLSLENKCISNTAGIQSDIYPWTSTLEELLEYVSRIEEDVSKFDDIIESREKKGGGEICGGVCSAT